MSKTHVIYEIADEDEESPTPRSTAVGLGDSTDDDGSLYSPPPTPSFCSRHAKLLFVIIAGLAVAVSAATGLVASHRSPSTSSASSTSSATADTTVDTTADTTAPALAPAPPPLPDGMVRGTLPPPQIYTLEPVGLVVKTFQPTVVRATPHDTSAFLQGLEYDPVRDQFFESTGLRGGQSSLRRVDIATGKVLQKVGFGDDKLFGEGLTMMGNEGIAVLTWEAGKGFVFDQYSFEMKGNWSYEGQGWGLATDRMKGKIYMSDGTAAIRVLDGQSLKELSRFEVTLNGVPQPMLNELEWVCGELWSNVWQTTKILRIDPTSGKVRSIIDAKGLPRPEDIPKTKFYRPGVLNGIAYSPENGRIWITGKNWPKVYEVTINDNTLDSQCNVGLR